MKTAAQCRDLAAYALANEAASPDPDLRAQWLKLAEVWVWLAESAETNQAVARFHGFNPD